MQPQNRNIPLITHVNPSSTISENFREIRTNLTFSTDAQSCKTLLITSSTPEEGKSMVLSNLAVTFAHVGKKVLMIDADLRTPMLHHIFPCTNDLGLSQALENIALLKQSIQETMIPNLELLPSGPCTSQPSELISKGLPDLLQELRLDYDLILIDSPSVLTYSDTQLIATSCEGVILIIRNGKVKRQMAKKAIEKLKFVKANIVGTVVNYGSH